MSSAPFFLDKGSREDSNLVVIAVSFVISFAALFVYLVMHLNAVRDASQLVEKVINEGAEARNALRINEDSAILADEAFKNLGRARVAFDEALLSAIHQHNSSDGRHSLIAASKFEDALQEYLVAVCDTAVASVAARKQCSSSDFEANMKMVTTAYDANGLRYALIARSSKTRRKRLEADRLDKSNHLVERNIFFDRIRDPYNISHCVRVDDIEPWVLDWHAKRGEAFLEPTLDAKHYYKSCLVVPISGRFYEAAESQRMWKRRSILKIGEEEILLGLLFIDSKKQLFDGDAELGIMEELAIASYSALHLADSVIKLLRDTKN